MSPTSQKVDFTLICNMLGGPATILNTIFLFNDSIWPWNLLAFQDLKLTQVPSFNKFCMPQKFWGQLNPHPTPHIEHTEYFLNHSSCGNNRFNNGLAKPVIENYA